MNPPSEISPSTQLILDELRKLHRLFDKFDARCAKEDAMRETSRGVPVPTHSAPVGAYVVADNWGGLFDGGDDSDEQHCEARSIVADNWGGLFEQPAHILEEPAATAAADGADISLEFDPTWTVAALHVLDTGEPEYISASDKELEVDEKVPPSTGNKVLKADVAQFNADQILRPPASESLRFASEQLESLGMNASQILSVGHKFLMSSSSSNPPPTTLRRAPPLRQALHAHPAPPSPLRRPWRAPPRPPRLRRPRRAPHHCLRGHGLHHPVRARVRPPRPPPLRRRRPRLRTRARALASHHGRHRRWPRRLRIRHRARHHGGVRAGRHLTRPRRPSRRVRLARWLLRALAAGLRPRRRRIRRPRRPHHLGAPPDREATSAPQHPLPPRQARRHAAAPTLLPPPPPPRDAATTSPIPIPPREASSLVLAAALRMSGAQSVHAARMFDEMLHRQRTTTASEQALVLSSQYAALMSAVVLHAHVSDREPQPPCNGLKLAMDGTSELVMSVWVATMAPASLSELLGGLFSRYITMFASTPVLGVLLLDCNATVREVHTEFQQMTELSSVILWVRDQLCITEVDFFATWDGTGSIQCCLYGDLCVTIHPWLLSVGECEFHDIALWCLWVKLWFGAPMGQQVKLLFLSCVINPKAMQLNKSKDIYYYSTPNTIATKANACPYLLLEITELPDVVHGITLKLCPLLLSGPNCSDGVLVFAEDSSQRSSCGLVRLHDNGNIERKAQIHALFSGSVVSVTGQRFGFATVALLPKPPELSFDPDSLFKLERRSSNCASLQHALLLLVDNGNIIQRTLWSPSALGSLMCAHTGTTEHQKLECTMVMSVYIGCSDLPTYGACKLGFPNPLVTPCCVIPNGASDVLSTPLFEYELLVVSKLLTGIVRGDFLHLSGLVQSELPVLHHSISLCCPCGLLQPVRWMAKGLLLHEQKVVDLRHADMKPWPPPAVLSSDLVEMEIVREGAKLQPTSWPSFSSRYHLVAGASTDNIYILRGLCTDHGLCYDKQLQHFPWDPGGSILLHRLGGKPKLKKGGMLGVSNGWALHMGHGLGLVEQQACWTAGRGRHLQKRTRAAAKGHRTIIRNTIPFPL